MSPGIRAAGAIAGIALLVSTMTGCADPADPPAAAPPAGSLQRGAELLQPFRQQLMAALEAGLADSPEAAVRVCRIEAPEIAARHQRSGVSMGRSSHRLRNPDNAPEAWMQQALDHYLANQDEREPRAVLLDDGRVGYAAPIITQPQCLVCHGETLAPGVARRIAELYPEDRATGFEVGELRGIFWVAFPAGG